MINKQGTAILDALSRGTMLTGASDLGIPGQESVLKCYQMLKDSYDEELGGFGKAPKFPQPGRYVERILMPLNLENVLNALQGHHNLLF